MPSKNPSNITAAPSKWVSFLSVATVACLLSGAAVLSVDGWNNNHNKSGSVVGGIANRMIRFDDNRHHPPLSLLREEAVHVEDRERALSENLSSGSAFDGAEEEPISSVLIGIILVLFLCAISKALLEYFQIHWLPEACAYILIGAVISGMGTFLMKNSNPTMVYDKLYFDEDFFLQILLPPIIFQAALNIDKAAFRRDFAPIVLFSVVGTAISAISIGWMTYWMTSGRLPLLESLVFGALISSIDPVAILGILSGVGVDQSGALYTLIFGESLLNDGVAIVLFETLRGHLGDENALDDPETYKAMASHFGSVLFGSMGVAIVLGMCSIVFYWALQGRQAAVTEVGTFFGWALLPYYVAGTLEFSGIIAVLVMGFIMDFYILGGGEAAVCNIMPSSLYISGDGDDGPSPDGLTLTQAFQGSGLLSAQCCKHIGFVTHTLATTSETIVFAYLGLFLFDEDKEYSMLLDQVAIWSCIISRAFMVLLLSAIVNLGISLKLEERLRNRIRSCLNVSDDRGEQGRTVPSFVLDRKTQFILFLAGIRGAVSFALVSNIPVDDTVTEKGTLYKAELKAMTSSAIIFTLFAFGALTYYSVDSDNTTVRSTSTTSGPAPISEEDAKLLPQTDTGSTKQYGATTS